MKYFYWIIYLLSFNVWAGGDSSDGHTHTIDLPPSFSQALLPRAVANSEQFELVAMLYPDKLLIYLDNYASNLPVIGAKVEVDSADIKGIASETSLGIYQINLNNLAKIKHSLTISIETADYSDLLPLILDNSSNINPQLMAKNSNQIFDSIKIIPWIFILIGFVILIAILIYFWKKFRYKQGER